MLGLQQAGAEHVGKGVIFLAKREDRGGRETLDKESVQLLAFYHGARQLTGVNLLRDFPLPRLEEDRFVAKSVVSGSDAAWAG